MLPEKIDVEVREGQNPCANALVKVTLVATGKNNFGSTWGPTSAAGRLTITRQGLLDEGMKDRDFFLMDYRHPEHDFSGQVLLRIARREDIERALKAFGEFSPHTTFRPGYEAMLRVGLSAWQQGTLSAPEIFADAGDAKLTLVIER